LFRRQVKSGVEMLVSKIGFFVRVIKSRFYLFLPTKSIQGLVIRHFRFWSHSNHQNVGAFLCALAELGGKPAVIVETGTSAWGTDSTRLWARYVQKYGGELWSVNLRREASERLRGQLKGNVHLVVGDSVEFLHGAKYPKADLYFLDSWDIDWSDPDPAAHHGYKEFQAIQNSLKIGDIVIIDDTPRDYSFLPNSIITYLEDGRLETDLMPGKGALVFQEIHNDPKYLILYHEYSLVVKVIQTPDEVGGLS
jgi:hypothetical protein